MLLPLQTTYRHVPRLPGLDALIQEEADKLELFFKRITSCLVLIERVENHQRRDAPFHIRIELRVPGEEIVVSRSPDVHATLLASDVPRGSKSAEVNATNKDAALAVRKAFHEAGRQLQDYVTRKADHPKAPEPTTGEVMKIGEDYGFLRDAGGDEIYFHRNSVLNDEFGKLHVGSTVRFVAEAGDKGPQATTVYPHAHRAPGRPST